MPNGKMIGILRRFENGVYFIRNLICSKNVIYFSVAVRNA